MENSIKIFTEILEKIKETLLDFNCHSNIKLAGNDAGLYGKFANAGQKYKIVVHLSEEEYVPVTSRSEKKAVEEGLLKKLVMPSLGLRSSGNIKSSYSEKEHAEIKKKFEQQTNAIVTQFLDQLK